MIGKYEVVIYDSVIRYELVLERKVTIICGNSGTGKTSLYRMCIELDAGNKSVKSNYKDKIVVLLPGYKEQYWKYLLQTEQDKIFIADESVRYVQSREFAEVFNKSNNYLIVISRAMLLNLTYSWQSIFVLESQRVGNVWRTCLAKRWWDKPVSIPVLPDLVITEDEGSGRQMMSSIFRCKVLSGGGKDNVRRVIAANLNQYECIYVIADGAGFGGCIADVAALIRKYKDKVYVLLPESFEYMLLTCKVFQHYLRDELIRTYAYCDTKKYLTWEQYYTQLLADKMQEMWNISYNKSHLHPYLKTSKFKEHIKVLLRDIDSSAFV